MNHLQLSKTNESDLDTVISMELDMENVQFIVPNSKDEHSTFIRDENIEHLLFKFNNKTIGFAILDKSKNENNSIEFRRIVIKEKGKGFGRIAIKKIKKYCFEQLNCHRLWLDVLETNERARYLYHSEGFKEEGKLRDCLMIQGKYKSLIIMSILENEYSNLLPNNLDREKKS